MKILSMLPISPVVLITGEGDQGQNLMAMAYLEMANHEERNIYHNGCANRGSLITTGALSSDQRFSALMRIAPEGSVFILADADCIPATVSVRGQSEPQWLNICRTKNHLVVLTTRRGREHYLQAVIGNINTSHLVVEAGHDIAGIFVTAFWGELHERLPKATAFVKHGHVVQLAKLTDGAYTSPSRPVCELIDAAPRSIVVPALFTEAVLSTETPMPKHPANSLLLTTTTKQNEHFSVRTTELLGLIWLESVNKTRDEQMAIQAIEWASEKWRLDLWNVEFNSVTTYPDGLAETAKGPVNIEVTKVQPRWPSEATLGELVDSVRSGKAPEPQGLPIVQCRECGRQDVPGLTDVHILPRHDESHKWTCTFPQRFMGPDWPGNLTALPELKLDLDHLCGAIAKAVSRKNERVSRFGRGKQNWLVLIIEGFPYIEGLETLLHDFDWQSFDGVFITMSDQFGSAIHGLYPNDDRRVILLKCPEKGNHICYHPGFTLVVRKDDGSMDALREGGRERGVTYLITDKDGTLLAEQNVEPPQPTSILDVQRGIRSAMKDLPYRPPSSEEDIP